MELFFEFLIRPSTYFDLMHSDKAFAPTTARNINRFHLFFETCGLILYLPSIGCSFTENYCWDNIWFNHIDATLYAVRGTDQWKASWSRFSLGLIFLRCFCLLRHWKQMWIITMFRGKDEESCKFCCMSIFLAGCQQSSNSSVFAVTSVYSKTATSGPRYEKEPKRSSQTKAKGRRGELT